MGFRAKSFKLNGVNPLAYLTLVLENMRNKAVELPIPYQFGRLGQEGRIRPFQCGRQCECLVDS